MVSANYIVPIIGALFFLYIETAAWFAGFMVVSIMLAVIFGKVMRER